MNCKFCGNYIPDGGDTCSVCGRRDTEDPMGKLLSENQPQNFAPASEAANTAAVENSEKKVKTEIITPLIAIALSALGWLYSFQTNVFDTIKTLFNDNFKPETQLGDDSGFVEGGSASLLGKSSLVAIGSLVVIAIITVIGIIGIVALFKRLVNRAKAKN